MLNIITAPNSVLSQKAKAVGKIDKAVQKLLKDMEETLLAAKDPEGVGLAAPQIGKSLQIFLAKPSLKSPTLTFINPKIVETEGVTRARDLAGTESLVSDNEYQRGGERQAFGSEVFDRETQTESAQARRDPEKNNIKLEGCLSLPNIWGEVKRDPKIKLQYQLITNNHELITKTRTFSGFIATIIQHETDHLNGILFPKRVLEQKGKLYKSRRNKKGEDVFEEIEL